MEASSHSLVQHRVTGCTFEAAIFTNLTQDHLDYHHTMEEYFQAKRLLFDNQYCKTKVAVLNYDDSYGRRLLEERRDKNLAAVSYGFDPKADFRIANWTSSATGSQITIDHRDVTTTISTPLFARFNAYNIAGVFAATYSTGIPLEAIRDGITGMNPVPGRLERIDFGQPFLILIDYAHTDDALRQLLQTIRSYTIAKIILVFGCGGERDRGKRPIMGRVAGELADIVVLTSDNPRHEDPEQIIRETQVGFEETGNKNLHIYIDRKDAILAALQLAKDGDTLLLAGKGHEDYQVIGDTKFHFDEREILAEYFTTKTRSHEGIIESK